LGLLSAYKGAVLSQTWTAEWDNLEFCNDESQKNLWRLRLTAHYIICWKRWTKSRKTFLQSSIPVCRIVLYITLKCLNSHFTERLDTGKMLSFMSKGKWNSKSSEWMILYDWNCNIFSRVQLRVAFTKSKFPQKVCTQHGYFDYNKKLPTKVEKPGQLHTFV